MIAQTEKASIIEQVNTFLTMLSPDDILELRAIRKLDNDTRKMGWGSPSELCEKYIDWMIRYNEQGYGIYAGVNCRRDYGLSTDKNVRLSRVCFVDFDHISNGDGIEIQDDERMIEVIRERIEAARLPLPSLMLFSGHGVWCYWKLDKEISPSEFTRIQKKLAAKLQDADTGVCNPERVCRLPGFVNNKDVPHKKCYIVAAPLHPVKLFDIDEALDKLPDRPVEKNQDKADDGGMVLEGDRNTFLKKEAGRLRREGMERDELSDELHRINQARCHPPKTKKEVDAWVDWICKKPTGKQSIAKRLMAVVAECKLIASTDNRVFIQPQGRRPLEVQSRGGGARAWLRSEYFKRYNVPVRDGDLSTVCETAAALAMDKKPVPVYTRIRADKEQIILDLGWDGNEAIVIDPGDLPRIEQNHNILFVRTDGATAPMPRPNFEADKRDVFQTFHELMGLSREDTFKLICWLIQCWQPAAPYLILFLTGGAGCGKTSATGYVRYIADPLGDGGIRFSRSPKDSSDLIAFATCCHVLAVDNVSFINRDLSDTIAGLATGTGNFTRRLYTNSDVHCVVRQMPQIINGLSPGGLQPDVKDRMLHISLKQREHVIPAGDWWERARSLAPDLIGVLCQACAYGLENLPDMPSTSEFRMADACRWIAAAQPFLTDGTVWEGLDFATIYRETRQTDAETLLDEDPLLHQLVGLIREHGSIAGTASQILDAVEDRANRNNELDALVKSGQWPKNARAFALKLTVYEPILKDGGICHTEPSRRVHCYSTILGGADDTPI